MRRINLKKFQVASSGTARDINRRIILNIVRTRQPLSRADVARHTGLQRSTVSLIVDQLIDEGWVVEGEYGRLPRGRRPIFLQIDSDKTAIIGVNIRPTITTIGVADLNGHFLSQRSMKTLKHPDDFVAQLGVQIRECIAEHPKRRFEGIGISVPGRINHETQRMAFAPNLGWKNVDLKQPLEKATGLSVEVENAANACALAEHYFGEKSEGIENLIVVTVSEGIGTGIVSNGQLVRGTTGMAGEFGHVTFDPNGPVCGCGNRGCWEVFASNNAALRYYREIAGDQSSQPDMHINDLIALAQSGDGPALEALRKTAGYLGLGMANLMTVFDPGIILIVGEITRAWNIISPYLPAQTGIFGVDPEIRGPKIVATDDELQPRLRGTIALVLEKHLGAPPVA